MEQVVGAMEFITRNLFMSSRIDGLKRQDRYEIPIEAIREAVVNAVVHREYLMSSASIIIRIFDDRLEIDSPGLPLGFDIADPTSGCSMIRNQVIASVFKVIGFIERYGTGIPRMIDSCASNGNKPPIFSEDGQWFRVTFPRVQVARTGERSREDLVLAAIASDSSITQKKMIESTGIPSTSLKRILNDLKKRGVMTYTGSGRSGEWIINDDFE